MRSAGRRTRRRRFRWAGVAPFLRLAVFAAVLCVPAAGFVLRSARADVAEALWAVGPAIMAFPGAPREEVRQLQLNGARLSFRTQAVEGSLADVLDHYEAICGSAIATQSARSDVAGYVACLDMGDAPQDLGALVSRFVAFSETGNLRELGAPRYAFARRGTGGPDGKVFVLTMWVDSALNLYRMLPRESSDAAGGDLLEVPRPPGSRRILSAWEEGQPSGVLVYRVAAKSARELESFYRVELPRAGWRVIERHPGESVRVDDIRLLTAAKGNRLVTVLCQPEGASQAVLTLLTSGPS